MFDRTLTEGGQEGIGGMVKRNDIAFYLALKNSNRGAWVISRVLCSPRCSYRVKDKKIVRYLHLAEMMTLMCIE